MSKKYRIKVAKNRTLGPLSINQIGRLYVNGHLNMAEDCQSFPGGAWKKIDEFDEIMNLIGSIMSDDSFEVNSSQQTDSETIVRYSLPQDENSIDDDSAAPFDSEFDIKEVNETINEVVDDSVLETEQLQQKLTSNKPEQNIEKDFNYDEFNYRNPPDENKIPPTDVNSAALSALNKSYNPEDSDPTLVVKKKSYQDIEKTKIVNKEILNDLVFERNKDQIQLEKIKNKERLEDEAMAEEANIEPEIDKQTEFIRVDALPVLVKKEIVESEKKLKSAIDHNNKELELLNDDSLELDENEQIPSKKKPGIRPIALFAFLALAYFFIFENDTKKIAPYKPKYVQVEFPEIFDVENEEESRKNLLTGISLYNNGTFISKVGSLVFFKLSLSHKFRNNRALGFLIKTYAELLPNVKDKRLALNTISNLIDISKAHILSDSNIAMGAAMFYAHYKKHSTAIRLIENHIRYKKTLKKLKKNSAEENTSEEVADKNIENDQKESLNEIVMAQFASNQEHLKIINYYFTNSLSFKNVLSLYLLLAIDAEEVAVAKKIYGGLINEDKVLRPNINPQLPIAGIKGAARYLSEVERYAEAKLLIENGLIAYPSSIELMLEYCDYLARDAADKALDVNLSKIKLLEYGQSPYHFSLYLEKMAMLSAYYSQFERSAKYLKKAIMLNDNDDLRSKLSLLEIGGDALSDIILESKAEDLMRVAKKEIRQENWEQAIVYALKAVDLLPYGLNTRLMFAKLQVKRGYYELAFKTLLSLKDDFALSLRVNVALINAYIQALRLEDASFQLSIMSQSKMGQTAEYCFLLGSFYAKQGNLILTIKWINEGLRKDPLNVENYFFLAKTFMSHRKYSNAKQMLLKGLDLDPTNPQLHALYAKILYELKSVDAAIGYLRKTIEDLGNRTKLLSEIAIYYYRSGQIKAFERYKKKIELTSVRNENFYSFLIKSSLLDEKFEDAITYSKEYLNFNPGDLAKRMALAENLFNLKRYKESVIQLNLIKDRLSTYPKIFYFLSLNSYELSKLGDALKYAEEEIKLNPQIAEGYYAAGRIYFAQQEYPKAIKMFDQALSKNRKFVKAMLLLGEIRYRQDFFESSREIFLRAKKYAPDDAAVYKFLGHIYRAIGQPVLAKDSYKTYLELAPFSKDKTEIKRLMKSLQ